MLIHAGSGAVGQFAIQLAKLRGAYVYTTTSTKNVGWVKKLGADRVIDYKTEKYLDIVKNIDVVYEEFCKFDINLTMIDKLQSIVRSTL